MAAKEPAAAAAAEAAAAVTTTSAATAAALHTQHTTGDPNVTLLCRRTSQPPNGAYSSQITTHAGIQAAWPPASRQTSFAMGPHT